MKGTLTVCAIFGSLAAIRATPLIPRQSITTLTSAQVAAFKPFTYFASAAYCTPSTTLSWTCGASCEANSDFIPVASGGDGSSIQYWFVGYSPSQSTVIVSHQGTDTSKLEADLTDVEFVLTNLGSTLFPGISSSVKVHDGFGKEQAQSVQTHSFSPKETNVPYFRTATTILSAVQSAISAHKATKVTVVGHSLGENRFHLPSALEIS
ncbi:hypothetical protein H0H93_008092 [Arthromyces matolae]|nr:hypothetical protein H0H93_008092 [Arthromyces matolae]